MKVYLKLSVIVLIAILSACKKQQNGGPSLSVSDFPVKVGDSWTYLRIDSANNVTDTVTNSIAGLATINGKQMYVWIQSSVARLDTSYLLINGDTLTFYAIGNYTQPSDLFLFPVQNGFSWSASPIGGAPDEYTCTVINTETINGIAYSNIFSLNRLESGLDFSVSESVGIVRGIGIITYYMHENNSGINTIYRLSLINYHLM